MKHLRPHSVFDRIEEVDRMATICLPTHYSLTSMLERTILAALLKLVKPRTVFEFGTYVGETTLILAANTNAQVYSIDIDENQLQTIDAKLDEFECANVRRRFSERPLFQRTQYADQIETIIGDSTTYDLSSFYQRIDFVLIDGGHHINVVESDTQQALKMLSLDHPACVVWHDYGNPKYEITDYLNTRNFEIYHVAETTYAFYMKNVGETPSLIW